MKIALQLYSVREYTKTIADLEQTLDKLRKCGFEYVETAGYYGLEASALAELLKRHGFACISTHTGPDALFGGFDKVVADHLALGASSLGLPYIPGHIYKETPEGYAAFGQAMDAYASRFEEQGITLSFHNHDAEFKKLCCVKGLDYMLNASEKLCLQLDTGNCFMGGGDPVDWLTRYQHRTKNVHFKDLKEINGEYKDCAIGSGVLDWNKLGALTKSIGADVIIEIEHFENDIWETLKTSHEFVTRLLK